MKYVYLIAYGFDGGYGSVIFMTSHKIKSNQSFEEAQQYIRKQTQKDTLAIMSFQLIGKRR